jgi:sporulation protein YlmC with PRC-barrel domain
MKSKLYTTLLLCAGGTLIAGPAFAQADATTRRETSPTGTSPRIGERADREYPRNSNQNMMQSHSIRASKLTGTQIKNSAGETLGTIEDIVFNPRSGQAQFAIISLNNPSGTTPTGTGEKLVPVPWRLLNMRAPEPGTAGVDQYKFTTSIDQTKLAMAPNFDKNQWPDWSQPDWNHKIYSYYGVQGNRGGGLSDGLEREGAAAIPEKGSGASVLQPKSDNP